MMRLRACFDQAIEWLSTEFVDWFGTPSAFAICTALLVAWLSLIPILGLGHWNATVGLGGNTSESTAELFLEIAILIVARRVDVRQRARQEHDEQLVEHVATLVEHIATLTEQLASPLQSDQEVAE